MAKIKLKDLSNSIVRDLSQSELKLQGGAGYSPGDNGTQLGECVVIFDFPGNNIPFINIPLKH
jgi:hypothetical protein